MFGKARNLAVYIDSLKHLSDYDGKYDEIYPMHGDFPQKPELIGKLLDGAQAILEGTASGSEVDIFGTKAVLYKFPYAGFLCDR